MLSQIRPLNQKCSLSIPPLSVSVSTFKTLTIPMNPSPSPSHRRSHSHGFIITSFSRSTTRSLSLPSSTRNDPIDGILTLQEWQNWGTNSPVPASIIHAIDYLKAFEIEADVQMVFGCRGRLITIEEESPWTTKVREDWVMMMMRRRRRPGPRSSTKRSGGAEDESVVLEDRPNRLTAGANVMKRKGVVVVVFNLMVDEGMESWWFELRVNLKVRKIKKHRAAYKALNDSEMKLQFFSARQIACRLLGSRGYLCQKCWLANEDCMCLKVKPRPLSREIRFWLYMHPKDFLRQNNTGKVLWQVFGLQAATLCLYGIAEHEDIMWNEFKKAGKNKVWCPYPSKPGVPQSAKDYFLCDRPGDEDCNLDKTSGDSVLNFILIDGTWNNSTAMFKRLKERAKLVWGEDDIACISVATGASVMHKLRPQPSWDHTCTAAAAAGLLSELHLIPQFSPYCLDKQGEAIEDALDVLLETLTTRRLRMGRSITRKMRSPYVC